MKILPIDEIVILIVIAIIIYFIRKFLRSVSFSRGGQEFQNTKPPSSHSFYEEAVKDIYSPERSALPGNIYYRRYHDEVTPIDPSHRQIHHDMN